MDVPCNKNKIVLFNYLLNIILISKFLFVCHITIELIREKKTTTFKTFVDITENAIFVIKNIFNFLYILKF